MSAVPGTTALTPSVLVRARSAWGVRVSLSVPLAGVPVSGVMVAMLTRVPVAAGAMLAVKLKVRVAPVGRSTVVVRAPVPLVAPVTLPPPVWLTNVQVAALTPDAYASDSVAPVTSLGPKLLTTIV